MPAVAAGPAPHRPPEHGALPSAGGHGRLAPLAGSRVSVLHLAVVQAGAEGLGHALGGVLLAVVHRQRGLVPLHPPTVDLLQGEGVLRVERVVLVGVRVVLVRGLGRGVGVVLLVLLLLLLSLLRVVLAAGPVLVLDVAHPPLHRGVLQTLVKPRSYAGVSVSATGPLRVSRTGPRHRLQAVIGGDERRLGGEPPQIEILCKKSER